MWRLRNMAALSVVVAGLTFAGIGLVTRVAGLVVFGVLVLLVAAAYRTRAHHDYWVTCWLHPTDGTILVEPTHPGFDAAARDLFVRSLR